MSYEKPSIRETIDISGFGGSYEYCCQLILESGMKYLDEHPEFTIDDYQMFPNIFGVLIPPKNADEFETAMLSHPFVKENGATGAMHQAVVQHLYLIKSRGYDPWLKTFSAARRYWFDGTIESCPKTDLSRERDGAR